MEALPLRSESRHKKETRMTTIRMDPTTEARLREKAQREGRTEEDIIAAIVAEQLEWEARDRAEAIEGIRRGLTDVEAGREIAFEEYAARIAAEKKARPQGSAS
jgi:predicted transcriptional regulator